MHNMGTIRYTPGIKCYRSVIYYTMSAVCKRLSQWRGVNPFHFFWNATNSYDRLNWEFRYGFLRHNNDIKTMRLQACSMIVVPIRHASQFSIWFLIYSPTLGRLFSLGGTSTRRRRRTECHRQNNIILFCSAVVDWRCPKIVRSS